MGSGSWDAETYDRLTRHKITHGDTFAYTREAYASGHIKAHDSLNPLNADGSAAVRESRDSDEHPTSTPIVIGFDVTGSMRKNPAKIQKSLKNLMGILTRRNVVPDPQIAITAYGDAYCDDVPLQVSQFESDNRIDEALDNVFVEGGGGANDGETSALLAYYIAHYVKTDSWDKHGKKGYAFFIGDECTLDLSRSVLSKYLGISQSGDVTAAEAFDALLEKWDTYFLLIDNDSAEYQNSEEKYGDLLHNPQRVVKIPDGSAAAATIVSLIGAAEQTLDKSTIGSDLVEAGFNQDEADVASKAVSRVFEGDSNVRGSSKAVVEDYGDLDL